MADGAHVGAVQREGLAGPGHAAVHRRAVREERRGLGQLRPGFAAVLRRPGSARARSVGRPATGKPQGLAPRALPADAS